MATAAPVEATVTAPVNIAVIKYWGKRDEQLILPTNGSLSATLSQDILHSKTTARADPALRAGDDRLWLNGHEEDVKASKRLCNVIQALRARRRALEAADAALPKLSEQGLRIVSENNFPTAAGLASSASGFAALVAALAALYDLPDIHAPENTPSRDQPGVLLRSQLSALARMGSGSACRSLFGGFVAWESGTAADGSDSLAVPVAPSGHWPEIEALVLVVHDGRKGVSSTSGMQTTAHTSPLAQHRFDHIVPDRMAAMKSAILARDFDAFAELTMKDSNQFHAVCLDTFPPIFYLNDTSRAIIQLITDLNTAPFEGYQGKFKVAYTYDAGPNAVLYLPKQFVPTVMSLLDRYFPKDAETSQEQYFADPYKVASYSGPGALEVPTRVPVQPAGSIKRILHARVGDGPRVLHRGPPGNTVSLMNAQGGPSRTD